MCSHTAAGLTVLGGAHSGVHVLGHRLGAVAQLLACRPRKDGATIRTEAEETLF